MFARIVFIALLIIAFTVPAIAQNDRCLQAQQDGQKRINENFVKMGDLIKDLQKEVARCGPDSICQQKAALKYREDYMRYVVDNEKIRSDWGKTCMEEANRQAEMQTAKQVFPPGKRSEPGVMAPRNPFQPPVQYR